MLLRKVMPSNGFLKLSGQSKVLRFNAYYFLLSFLFGFLESQNNPSLY
jgi:hypothetical protein